MNVTPEIIERVARLRAEVGALKFKLATAYTADEIFFTAGGMLVGPFSDTNLFSVTDLDNYDQYDFVQKEDGYYLSGINGERLE